MKKLWLQQFTQEITDFLQSPSFVQPLFLQNPSFVKPLFLFFVDHPYLQAYAVEQLQFLFRQHKQAFEIKKLRLDSGFAAASLLGSFGQDNLFSKQTPATLLVLHIPAATDLQKTAIASFQSELISLINSFDYQQHSLVLLAPNDLAINSSLQAIISHLKSASISAFTAQLQLGSAASIYQWLQANFPWLSPDCYELLLPYNLGWESLLQKLQLVFIQSNEKIEVKPLVEVKHLVEVKTLLEIMATEPLYIADLTEKQLERCLLTYNLPWLQLLWPQLRSHAEAIWWLLSGLTKLGRRFLSSEHCINSEHYTSSEQDVSIEFYLSWLSQLAALDLRWRVLLAEPNKATDFALEQEQIWQALEILAYQLLLRAKQYLHHE